jgi:hypothetical protein
MNDSTVIFQRRSREWLLLIHQIPPKPDYFRVKVRRRLERLGAIPLKNSVYVLPLQDDTVEDFAWLAREIRAEGGEATLCRASFLDGVGDADLEEMFRTARDADYAEVERMAGESSDEAELERARRRLAQVRKVDFFESAGRERAERAVAAPAGAMESGSRPHGALWVTRPGVKVDRMASAWLIRRFIDPTARFAFDPGTPGLRFDTYEGEYTHEGDRCTFEVLLERFSLDDAALRAVSEVVHDIDCKDGKFDRAEAPGIAAIVDGIAATLSDDAERLRQGAVVFEGLYQKFTAGAAART